ncbi:hypothetical protein [Agromyces larvae]|uniref:Uncharacterized protein n=1 Tax=Agromyces larvae TaxID=2929802 RepID=A0ABY4BVQ1_9MICO|nr:hypothetical protein [Agromyces larvae]UOE43302.1 hypothetical protein MTO99_14070 [Agromyces larvae]
MTLERPIFTSYSAAAVLGLPIIGRWPDDVVLLGATRNGHRRRGVVEVSRIGEPAIVEVGGILMTSIEYTLIQLCRAAPVADALAAVDAALRAPRHPKDRPALTTIERLRAEHERMLPYRGSRRTEAVLERATDRCDSVLETASRLLFERHGFAEPELQHSLYLDELGITAQVDFFWRDVEAGAEADGRGKYRRADIAESAETVIAEKDRENALRRRLRAFDRWDWRDCRAETPVVRRLDAMGVPRTRRPRSLG